MGSRYSDSYGDKYNEDSGPEGEIFERTFDEETIDHAEDLLADIVYLMGFDCDIETELGDDVVFFNITGPGSESFIRDRSGSVHTEIVNALSLVLRRARFALRSGYRFTVDAGGYREGRMQTMQDVANVIHDKVTQCGITLDCFGMNTVDRRAIHHHLSEYDDIVTESEGVGIFRHLKIRRA